MCSTGQSLAYRTSLLNITATLVTNSFNRMESAVPVSAELFPQHYTDSVWPEEFQLSDHRLLVTQFELKSDRLSLEEMWYRSSATAEERRQCCFSLCGRGLTDANL